MVHAYYVEIGGGIVVHIIAFLSLIKYHLALLKPILFFL